MNVVELCNDWFYQWDWKSLISLLEKLDRFQRDFPKNFGGSFLRCYCCRILFTIQLASYLPSIMFAELTLSTTNRSSSSRRGRGRVMGGKKSSESSTIVISPDTFSVNSSRKLALIYTYTTCVCSIMRVQKGLKLKQH